VKVSAIIESSNYDTITVDELFSKLKSTEIDYQTPAKLKNPSALTMTLILGNSSSSSANPSQISFALSSLVSVSEEQLETLGDDELALIINRFSWFHNNRLNHRRGGDQKVGCYNCGDPNHFIARCPKKNKHSSDKYDSGRRKDKHDYTSKKYKSKKGFDKEALKKIYRKKAKAQERAFLASLSDLDNDSDDDRSSSPSSDDESERKMKEKLTCLCFIADSTHGGFYTMAIDEEVKASKDEVSFEDDTSEVSPSINDLAAELDSMNVTLIIQDKLLKCATRERKEFKDKLDLALKELEVAKKCAMVVSDEVECDECVVHMSNFSKLQSKYASLLDEYGELKARLVLLGACKSCSGLQSELAEKNSKISILEKASSDSTIAKCACCESLVLELESCWHDKMRSKEENTYLRSILSWVSSSEP